jgi:hypothetical protein
VLASAVCASGEDDVGVTQFPRKAPQPNTYVASPSAGTRAAQPASPPPQCVPEYPTDGTHERLYTETRTLRGPRGGVVVHEFGFRRFPGPQKVPDIIAVAVSYSLKTGDESSGGEIGSGLGG